MKARCTSGDYRRITRWEREDVLDMVQERLDAAPEAARLRRQTVEHVFGTLKRWMGSTHFLAKTLPRVRTEMKSAGSGLQLEARDEDSWNSGADRSDPCRSKRALRKPREHSEERGPPDTFDRLLSERFAHGLGRKQTSPNVVGRRSNRVKAPARLRGPPRAA